MSISTYLEPIANAEELVKKLLIDEFQTSDTNAQMLYDDYVKQHIEPTNKMYSAIKIYCLGVN